MAYGLERCKITGSAGGTGAAALRSVAFRFEGLEVFQLAVEYGLLCYRLTTGFPKMEMFGMTANLRRAATSVALNIAEGAGRGTPRDFMHFVDVASGSLFETVATFILAERLGYIDGTSLNEVRADAQLLGRKLHSFKRSLAG